MNFSAPEPYAFGVTGYPLGHSLSPLLHQAALESCSLRGEYRLYPIPPLPAGREGLAELAASLRDGRLDGLNVTIPHKQAVISYLDELTVLARRIGAVNTLFRRDGSLVGDNTDAPGFMADLNKQYPQTLLPQSALVLGAGGSARAIVYALLDTGWRVTIAARRPEKAQELLEAVAPEGRSCMAISLESLPEHLHAGEKNQHGASIKDVPLALIVNTTPVGMAPDVDHSPWPKDLPFPSGVFVYDLVYNPLETALMRLARSSGLPAASGLGMLIEQAALSFERWTGVYPSIDAMRQAVMTKAMNEGAIKGSFENLSN